MSLGEGYIDQKREETALMRKPQKAESQRIERAHKPIKCPSCGAWPVASIQYGEPAYSKQLQKDLDEGRIALGGCCVSFDDPEWKCTRCGLLIFKIPRSDPL